ncbi:MAG: glycosyl transferase family protein, UDP-N-acetylglucosamine:undecaprenyl-P N-acetylglucosaminyl 1-P transferase [Microgenomates group bacterium GW2011_GWC1_41_20]|uniref:UDP-N-acetylmuramyl pentapeptide phosphotransferase/UDP-N-acetylglucosamine-1-phosphate transferase n=6 Tax=Candidatus Woeseibacteriota TaxID=1752722 RepID=A0A0G0RUN3_9BACT|nr:MAG: UDP-N-acetylmuramyl pentapeptide phosphotransferase/UDP-N-acetylglucosamine-1-phosphate transferase [Candidatus Woesebacteria bacterium GW2011_GWB1_40_12]KKR56278.1 MAG: UDP-N-acetylmuramyl pentapeptide phosphotransferase/UDP-N-acetylglucosamine-1-phosphate transferase [Candidatus Woesebacteria bacterium GW2011_GWF1_40_24]KKR91062.1 MAG: UDP-N-acetylmuramyl pentapeptide phosphotransferase/UDP-N-acetylglucosamine-1-phosphate transferase [Candidatus Woesebacteria bacterium GW2011_GWD1_41_12
MNNLRNIFLLPWIISATIAFLTTPLVIKFAKKIGIIDDPAKNKHPKVIHTYPVPRGGGIPIFIALLAASLIFLPIDKHLIGILIGATILVVLGVLDDKYNINPYLRLAIGFVAAAAPIAAGIGISFISNPMGGIINLNQPQISFELFGETRSIWVASDIFAILWITFLMNIVNMGAKGVDGQLSGVTVIAALSIAFLSLRFSADITQWSVIILAAITAGAYFGFLPWHIFPQKIMPGYSGSTLAGYLLAVLSILSTTKVGTLIVVLGVPLIDTGYTIIRRILNHKSPVWGDRGHLHHRLLDAGLSKTQVAIFYWTVTAILGFLALNLNTTNKIYTMVGIAMFLGGLILWLTYKPKKTNNQKDR